MFSSTVDLSHNIISRKKLREFLTRKFSIDDLKVICFDLGLDYEEFGVGKRIFVVEMLNVLMRNEALHLLEAWLEQEGIQLPC